MAAAQQAGRAAELEDRPTADRDVPVRESLTARDGRALRRHLGGSAFFAPRGSSLGDLLERAALFSTIDPCRRCGETGRAPQSGTYKQALKAWRKKEAKRLKLYVAKPGMVGELLKLFDIEIRVYTPEEAAEIIGPLPESHTVRCPRCQGTGVVSVIGRSSRPITARPTGSSVRGSTGSVNMGNPKIAAYGRMSRRLRAVRSADPIGCAALELYYAPGGSYGAVWILTAAGQEMLRGNTMALHPEHFFTNLVEAEHEKHEAARGTLISKANTEAGLLVRRGARAWNKLGVLIPADEDDAGDEDEEFEPDVGPSDKAMGRLSADDQDLFR